MKPITMLEIFTWFSHCQICGEPTACIIQDDDFDASKSEIRFKYLDLNDLESWQMNFLKKHNLAIFELYCSNENVTFPNSDKSVEHYSLICHSTLQDNNLNINVTQLGFEFFDNPDKFVSYITVDFFEKTIETYKFETNVSKMDENLFSLKVCENILQRAMNLKSFE
jgi:hypothetical protein